MSRSIPSRASRSVTVLRTVCVFSNSKTFCQRHMILSTDMTSTRPHLAGTTIVFNIVEIPQSRRNKPHEKSVSRDFEILCKGKKIPKILCKIPTGTLRRSLRHSQIRANWDVFAPSKSTLSTRLMSTVLLWISSKFSSEKRINFGCK